MKALEKIVKTAASALAAGALFLTPAKAAQVNQMAIETPVVQSVGTTNYCLQTVTNTDSSVETRAYYNNHHFLSIIVKDKCTAIRTHPGLDVDGWGTTWYPMPFLPGATINGLTNQNIIVNGSTIDVTLSGTVSRGTSQTYGAYRLNMAFTYLPITKTVNGSGYFTIFLDGLLDSTTGDLNIFKMASSFLNGVPKKDGTNGNTGDFASVNVRGWKTSNLSDYTDFVWDPVSQSSHFPNDVYTELRVETTEEYNNVDTVKQGYAQINAAFKPSMKITMIGVAGSPMSFGAMYNTYESQNFWSDNIGITPLVLKTMVYPTHLIYQILLTSECHYSDSLQDLVTLTANGNSQTNYAGVYYTPDLAYPFKRIASLALTNGAFKGVVKASPEMYGLWTKQGCGIFKVVEGQ